VPATGCGISGRELAAAFIAWCRRTASLQTVSGIFIAALQLENHMEESIMSQNEELLLQKSARVQNWEDEEKASYDLETLREEFRKRLYANEQTAPPTGENGQSET
jgi:hypothetical protein